MSLLQVHLFDIDIPGKITFKESETLSPGPGGTVVDADAGRLGVAICYDLRFPELAMMYARRGVQLIIYPGGRQTCLFCRATNRVSTCCLGFAVSQHR